MTEVDLSQFAGDSAESILRIVPQDLADRYDSVVFDLDGVIYLSFEALPGAAVFVDRCREAGLKVIFVTNASWSKELCVESLLSSGIWATEADLTTAGDAIAHAVFRTGHREAIVVGGVDLRTAIRERGIRVLPYDELDVAAWMDARRPNSKTAVVLGYLTEFPGQLIEDISSLAGSGFPIFATNRDRMYPTASGPIPGTGALLDMLDAVIRTDVTVCGKPHATMSYLVQRKLPDAGRVLMVGDNIRVDVPFAKANGWDSLLVLTGATSPADVPGAADTPTYVEESLATAAANGFGVS